MTITKYVLTNKSVLSEYRETLTCTSVLISAIAVTTHWEMFARKTSVLYTGNSTVIPSVSIGATCLWMKRARSAWKVVRMRHTCSKTRKSTVRVCQSASSTDKKRLTARNTMCVLTIVLKMVSATLTEKTRRSALAQPNVRSTCLKTKSQNSAMRPVKTRETYSKSMTAVMHIAHRSNDTQSYRVAYIFV